MCIKCRGVIVFVQYSYIKLYSSCTYCCTIQRLVCTCNFYDFYRTQLTIKFCGSDYFKI
ncbi:unnamed protein product [Schistosoma curassoni]|uniref:Uncharacterized protein n=1 Tax=Schistosoma curassoni TaxID=6186 RepID=A0A183KFA4_9TREM|nr:unnamed protein product [Schistosoma curassoni]